MADGEADSASPLGPVSPWRLTESARCTRESCGLGLKTIFASAIGRINVKKSPFPQAFGIDLHGVLFTYDILRRYPHVLNDGRAKVRVNRQRQRRDEDKQTEPRSCV